MDFQIALMLGQDGVTNGAIYALLALALVLVFAVTRVIFIPQGEFIAFAALTLASLQAGKTPGTLWLLVGGGLATATVELVSAARTGKWRPWPRIVGWNLAYPLVVAGVILSVNPAALALWQQIGLCLVLLVPLGPMMYRLAYQPIADASTLVLLIVSVAVHFSLVGFGLVFFGADGLRIPAYSEASFAMGPLTVTGQSLWVIGSSVLLIAGLYLFFEHTLHGKALKATAFNRTGARLMGISPAAAGRLSFLLAALIGSLSGILIAPLTTVYYDSGFLISLKGFVGAIVGGLTSHPLAALGAVLVGLMESFASFWASAFKEVIVFTLIIPVLLWRSLTTHHVEEDS